MKVFFDNNVYVAEALLGEAAEEMVAATQRAGWRIFASTYLLDELERVLTEKLSFSARLAVLSRQRVIRRSRLIEPGASRHEVPDDPADSPILRAALAAGADYLVTNDRDLLALDLYEGLRIISMKDYRVCPSRRASLPSLGGTNQSSFRGSIARLRDWLFTLPHGPHRYQAGPPAVAAGRGRFLPDGGSGEGKNPV